MSKTRIDQKFEQLRAKGETAFVAYITAGDPNLDATVDTVLRLEEAGADVIELGIPFSDPLADGVANQRAAERALESGTTFAGVLKAVEKIREQSEIPLLFFSYMNPLYVRGFETSVQLAADAGVDGFLMVDISKEESGPFRDTLEAANLNHVPLVTPTSTDARVEAITATGSGFVYCVSRAGVTGEQSEMQKDAHSVIERTRRTTDLPVVLGFGISTPAQAAAYAGMADGIVVGSYIVNTFFEAGDSPEGRQSAAARVKELIDATKGN